MSDDEECAQDIPEAEYRAWLERQLPSNWAQDVPVRGEGILAYDMVLPKWPDEPPWTPFRDWIPRASGCYRLASGAKVHVKPDCRC